MQEITATKVEKYFQLTYTFLAYTSTIKYNYN